MPYLVISTSLNPGSLSRVLAREAIAHLNALGADAEFVDLQALGLPLCDGAEAYAHPAVPVLRRQIADAEGILLATPVYNFDCSAAAKNLVELTGAAWTDKVVGFVCAAGGPHSYMAVMGLANRLMLDFRTVIIPRFVYAVEGAFDGGRVIDEEVSARVGELAAILIRFGRALNRHSVAVSH